MSKGATIGVGKSMSIEAVSRGMTLKGVVLGLDGREGMGGHDFTVMVSMEGRPGPSAASYVNSMHIAFVLKPPLSF